MLSYKKHCYLFWRYYCLEIQRLLANSEKGAILVEPILEQLCDKPIICVQILKI